MQCILHLVAQLPVRNILYAIDYSRYNMSTFRRLEKPISSKYLTHEEVKLSAILITVEALRSGLLDAGG